MIYLDNNATTPLAAEVIRAMDKCLRTNFGNPSSGHSFGITARKTVEHAREKVAGLIGASPDEIIFTSGGTEANNMAIFGTAKRFGSGHIITSSIEHPSVLKPLKYLEQHGFSVTYLPVDKYGFISPASLSRHIRKDTILITVMHSNNETGVLQPIGKIGSIARERRIAFHTDAAQSVGKVPVNVKRLNAGLLTIVSHKFYGPKGVGALYKRKDVKLEPLLYGASHENGMRPGTENVCSIAGFGTAAEIAVKELKDRVRNMKRLSGLLYDELRGQIPGIKLNGHPAKRLPNTLNISFPGVIGSVLLEKLENEIAASTGSACHEGKHTPSAVLKAMGLSDEQALSAVRLSLGRDTTEQQIKKAAKAIVRAYRSL
ncbi:MAG: cysteine desulfurase [Nitrospiraceae bacterium]|nr:MAG: cysteine desulfurase [Nitrospiraceae bacterium]